MSQASSSEVPDEVELEEEVTSGPANGRPDGTLRLEGGWRSFLVDAGPDRETKPTIDGSDADVDDLAPAGSASDALGAAAGSAGGFEDDAGVILSHILGDVINAARTAIPAAVAVTTGLLVVWQKVTVVRRVEDGLPGR